MEGSVIATIRDGRVRGERGASGLAFRGLPYGADTGGAGRFLPPAPVVPWSGVREARAFGPRAPQFDVARPPVFDWLFSRQDSAENCLVLNVYTPSLEGRRPVMVWLHGGAFAFGSADVPVLDGGPLSAHGDVVVVTVNHRLNVFGYLPPLDNDDGEFADSGNAGMLDLVAALRWVRDNIAAFGGDPDCVTLFGQSGGGAKVAILLAMEAARGLVHRAIVQSPSSGFRVQEQGSGAAYTRELLSHFDLRETERAALQRVPAPALLDGMRAVNAAHGGDDAFRPVIDGRSLRAHPFHPQAPDSAAGIPMMVGYTATEASFFLALDPQRERLSPAQVLRRVARFMKIDETDAQTLLRGYAHHHPGAAPADLMVHIATDHMYRLTAVEGAERAASQGAPVYMYRFAWHSQAMNGFLRAPHTAEIPFVFGHTELAGDFTGGDPQARAFSVGIMDAWVRFARGGDPNGPGLPAWTPFSAGERQTMVLDAPDGGGSRMENDPAGATLALMAGYRRFVPGSSVTYRSD